MTNKNPFHAEPETVEECVDALVGIEFACAAGGHGGEDNYQRRKTYLMARLRELVLKESG